MNAAALRKRPDCRVAAKCRGGPINGLMLYNENVYRVQAGCTPAHVSIFASALPHSGAEQSLDDVVISGHVLILICKRFDVTDHGVRCIDRG